MVTCHFVSVLSSGDEQGSVRSILDQVQSYEMTYPTWLHPHRHRRSAHEEVSLSLFISLISLTQARSYHPLL